LSRTALSATAKYSTDEIYVSYGLSFTPMLGEIILGLWAVAHKRFNHIPRPKMAFNGKKWAHINQQNLILWVFVLKSLVYTYILYIMHCIFAYFAFASSNAVCFYYNKRFMLLNLNRYRVTFLKLRSETP